MDKTTINSFLEYFKNHKLIRQMVLFSGIGFSAFLLDTAIYWVLIRIGVNQYLALAISFVLTMFYNYFMSIRWVFDSKKKTNTTTILVFAVLSAIGLFLTEAVYGMVIHWLKVYISMSLDDYGKVKDVWTLIAKGVSAFVVMVYNFITRKMFLEKTISERINHGDDKY